MTSTNKPGFRVGQRVIKCTGPTEFYGRVVSIYNLDEDEIRMDVVSEAPGAKGLVHIYTPRVLRLAEKSEIAMMQTLCALWEEAKQARATIGTLAIDDASPDVPALVSVVPSTPGPERIKGDRLAACRICGGIAECRPVADMSLPSGTAYTVRCMDCGTRVVGFQENRQDAIDQWNKEMYNKATDQWYKEMRAGSTLRFDPSLGAEVPLDTTPVRPGWPK